MGGGERGSDTMKAEVEKAINARIRPALQMDGGDVELISVDEKTGTVRLALRGHCAHCAYAQTMTLKSVEEYLKQTVPGVKKVETVS
jgi:Fe-S cluster biogenesis protein NfuA